MNDRNHKPAVVQPGDGRKIMVLGMEVTVELSSAETNGVFYVFEAVIAPGDRVPPHVHSREDEIPQVLAGELDVYLGGETLKVLAGGFAFFPRNIVHGFSNTGKTPAKVRFLVSPGANFEKFFGELSALPANQPPDMAKVTKIFDHYGLPLVTEPAS